MAFHQPSRKSGGGVREAEASAPQMQPTHQIAFPGTERIHSVSFSPDGKVAYCLVDGKAVDLWAAAVSVWPEVLGAVVIVLVLAWAAIFRRVRGHPQVPGAPHCRKCNYNVIAQAPDSVKRGAARMLPAQGTRCPECGTDLSVRRPRRGRSYQRRLWLPTIIAAGAVAGYGIMLGAGLPRSGRATLWMGVWLGWVDDLAERHQIDWLQKHQIPVARVMCVDTASGRITGRLCTRRGYPVSEMFTSPGGGHLVFAEGDGTLVWVSTLTGWASTDRAAGTLHPFIGDPGIIGFSGTTRDPWVYYGVATQDLQGHKLMRSRLVRWRPSTGEQTIVVDEPAFMWTGGGNTPPVATARRYALLPWPEGMATVSAPNFTEAYDSKQYTLAIRAPAERGGQILREIRNSDPHMCSSPVVTAPDGSAIYLSNMNVIIGVDPRSGERLGTLSSRFFGSSPGDKFTLSADGGRLFMPVDGGSVLVRDTRNRRWIGELQHPKEFIAPSVVASPDNRWLAATPFKSAGGARGPYLHELFLYDLDRLGAAEGGAEKKPAE